MANPLFSFRCPLCIFVARTDGRLASAVSSNGNAYRESCPTSTRKILKCPFSLPRRISCQTCIQFQRLTFFSRREYDLRHGPRNTFDGTNLTQKFFQRTRVCRLHLEDEAFIAGYVVAFQNVAVSQHLRSEFVYVPLVSDGNADECRNIFSDLFTI